MQERRELLLPWLVIFVVEMVYIVVLQVVVVTAFELSPVAICPIAVYLVFLILFSLVVISYYQEMGLSLKVGIKNGDVISLNRERIQMDSSPVDFQPKTAYRNLQDHIAKVARCSTPVVLNRRVRRAAVVSVRVRGTSVENHCYKKKYIYKKKNCKKSFANCKRLCKLQKIVLNFAG